jgi:predicted nucleic acid-binding protein
MNQSKNYADSDFFLALMKDSDWLKEKAKNIYKEHKGTIWVTPFTIAEIMIVCKRENISIKNTLIQISRIVNLESVSWDIFLNACNYIEKGATIFDSLLMSFCKEENKIISSDNIYEKFGFNVISMKK